MSPTLAPREAGMGSNLTRMTRTQRERRLKMAGLSTYPAAAILRAEDIERARQFYNDVLGVRELPELSGNGMFFFEAGDGSKFSIYERQGMPAPENTTLGFAIPADRFDDVVAELREKGVVFEDYDIPEIGLKTVNGVSDSDGWKGAWFKDTEGNILNLSSM